MSIPHVSSEVDSVMGAVASEVVAYLRSAHKSRLIKQQPFVARVETILYRVPSFEKFLWDDLRDRLNAQFAELGWSVRQDLRKSGLRHDPILRFERTEYV